MNTAHAAYRALIREGFAMNAQLDGRVPVAVAQAWVRQERLDSAALGLSIANAIIHEEAAAIQKIGACPWCPGECGACEPGHPGVPAIEPILPNKANLPQRAANNDPPINPPKNTGDYPGGNSYPTIEETADDPEEPPPAPDIPRQEAGEAPQPGLPFTVEARPRPPNRGRRSSPRRGPRADRLRSWWHD